MYDTNSRTVVLKSTTGPNVGPNTYVLCAPKTNKKNWAPFLSTGPKSSIQPKNLTDALYDTRGYGNKIRGGSILKNKAKRFVYKTTDVPPPTHYNPKPIQCSKKKLKFDPKKPKLYVCRLAFTATVSTPSIPTKMDENGYELDSEGNIYKVPPDEEIPEEINIPTTVGTGIAWRWGYSSSKRFHSGMYETCGPGPAAYDVEIPKCRKREEEERYREMARRFSFVPRFLEAEELQAVKNNQPGPGAYDVDKAWKRKESKSIHPKPFIAGAARFTGCVSDTPPPSKYNVCDCSKKKKEFSVKCVPFGTKSPRFKKRRVKSTPGPASYEIKGALQEKLSKKIDPYALCIPPFNSTSIREVNVVRKDTLWMPSSADYPEDKEEDENEKKMDIYSSVFKNMVCRFYSPGEKRDYIGPAKYNVVKSFSKSRDRKSFSVAKVAFNSSGVRSKTPSVKLDVPCPTTYMTMQEHEYKGYHFAMSPRFTWETETPGPGLYKIHPRYEESTYKSVDTHNFRLKENVLRKKFRTTPQETRDRWLANLNKRKFLYCFDRTPDYEERVAALVNKLFDDKNI